MDSPPRTAAPSIEASEPLPIAILRLRQCDEGAAAALGDAFGIDWPTRPNTVASRQALSVLWLAPTEWMIMGKPAAEAAAHASEALGQALHHVADVTDGWAIFDVDGAHSRDLIAKGCSLDLHPRAFAVDACAQTLFAQCFAVLRRTDQENAFQLMVDQPLADHIQAWLADAAAEFAL
jgi:sarcosine oxidase, subunit gamma